MADTCTMRNKSGQPCSARAWRDGVCRWHHPDLEAQRTEERRRGGHARSNRVRASKHLADDALTAAELQGLVSRVLRQVISGELEPGIGNCVANLSRSLVAIREATTLEQRLAELERAAGVGRIA
jgi:hypothetical protein